MRMIELDGSQGEGGGQILRTSLSMSLLTGQPFRMHRIRANRDKPGLRAQHLAAVQSAARLGNARVAGARLGGESLEFQPNAYEPRSLTLDIGTAGSTALVLQTLFLPVAWKTRSSTVLTLLGGTFNRYAPSFPFLETAWSSLMQGFGYNLTLTMVRAGFYPAGGGALEARIEPMNPCANNWNFSERPPLEEVIVRAGVCRLPVGIASRMIAEIARHCKERLPKIPVTATLVEWEGSSPGTAVSVGLRHGNRITTFDGLGERGVTAERVAAAAMQDALAFESSPGATLDPYTADQVMLPLALCAGEHHYTTSAVTRHLRTNAETLRAFGDIPIEILPFGDDPEGPGAVKITGKTPEGL